MNNDNLEIIKELEKRRDNLWDELRTVGYSVINDKDMPLGKKEARIIQVRALEYEIEELRLRILELIESSPAPNEQDSKN